MQLKDLKKTINNNNSSSDSTTKTSVSSAKN